MGFSGLRSVCVPGAAVTQNVCCLSLCLGQWRLFAGSVFGISCLTLTTWALFQGSCWKDSVVGFSPAIPVKAEDAVKGDAVGIWCYRLCFVNREK